tara:strand:- start:1770 stop:1886 length:117 start_codon:yes stop_codon:yes gene_type:complete
MAYRDTGGRGMSEKDTRKPIAIIETEEYVLEIYGDDDE